MKALIRGGLLLAFAWSAYHVDAQEIQWQPSTPRTTNPIVSESTPAGPVGLGQPVRLNANTGIAPTSFQRVIRGQAPIEITVQPPPTLEKGGIDPKPPVVVPKDSGFPPAPAAIIPGPLLDGGCGDDLGIGGNICRPRFGRPGALGDCCPQRERCWFTSDYLLWWQRAQSVPTLVTSSPIGTDSTQIGIIGLSSTSVVYEQTPNQMRGGMRFGFGRWLPHFDEKVALEGNYFFLGRQFDSATFGSGDSVLLARPFTSSSGVANSEPFASEDRIGSTTINNYSQLWGAEANLRYKWRCGPGWWIDCLTGYRHLNMSEGIDITEDLTLTTGISAGTRFTETESFHTRNQFNGGQFGLDGECRVWNRFFLGMTAKVAVGNVHQIVYIDGSTTRTLNGVTETQPGALLATPTNIGKFTQNRFGVLPEVAVKFGYDVTDNLRVFVGYDFIYLSSVVRPGEQIDLNVNPNFRPFTGNVNPTGPRVPAVLLRTNDYWAQGLTFGMQYRW